MPTILDIFGLKFFFYSEEHLPIHVHIRNSDGTAKFNIEGAIELVYNKGIKPKDIKKATQIIEIYQEEFKIKWNEYFEKNK